MERGSLLGDPFTDSAVSTKNEIPGKESLNKVGKLTVNGANNKKEKIDVRTRFLEIERKSSAQSIDIRVYNGRNQIKIEYSSESLNLTRKQTRPVMVAPDNPKADKEVIEGNPLGDKHRWGD